MRKLFLAVAVVSMGLFSSCDKCKDAGCENGATCEKKVGDCNCATYYEGTKCENEVRKSYVGTYIGTSTTSIAGLPAQVDVDTMIIALSGTDKKMLVIKGDGTTSNPDIPMELTSNTAYKVSTSFIDGGILITAVGTGTISSSAMSLDATLSGTVQNQPISGTIKFSGIKQ